MSINHILKEKEFDIFCKNLNTDNINITDSIDNLKFKTQNGDIIDLSSLPDHGLPSQRLTSNGNGQVSWVSGSGTSGIEYSGGEPVQLGKLAKYNATDGSLVNETSFIDTDILLKDGSVSMTGNLNMNQNNILDVNDLYIDRLFTTAPSTEIQVENTLRMRGNDIIDTNNVEVNFNITTPDIKTDTITTSTTGKVLFNDNVDLFNNDILSSGNIRTTSFSSTDGKTNDIDVNANFDLQTTRNIKNVNILQTNEIAKTSGVAVIFDDNIEMGGIYDITNCNQLEVSSIASAVTPDINILNTLDLNNNVIENCLNVTTTDLNTDTISSNAPATEIKLGANTDLNLDGNSIIGLELINGIQPSGGVYSNPTSNNYSGSTAETDVLTGIEYGSKTIPSNDGFNAGSLFSLKIGGEFDATNNDTFTIRVLSNYNTVNEAEFVNIPITITDTNLTDRYFELEIDFAIRTTGGVGVASILTNGSFDYYNTNNLKKGTGINNLNNTTFRTDIDNTLSVTYQTTEASVNFTVDVATITKFY
jgi:hypothetical protein